MAELAIICPTYKRPQRLQKVADNIKNTTKNSFKLYWGCEADDRGGIMAAADTGWPVILNSGNKGYSDTVQTIYERTKEPMIFTANDDFEFTDGWDVAPLAMLRRNPDLMVVGVDDGIEPARYTTIFLFKRRYIEQQSGVIDMPNRVYYPYNHNFTDTEFTQTAIKRGVWDKIEGPCIKHLRLDDGNYQKNDVTFSTDHGIYLSRIHLFS